MTKEYESKILNFWKENNIYEKVKEKNKGNETFNHIDGPPYPTGEPHLGHIRNWSVKDSMLRFKRFQGYDVYARDGYDVHGLPVENKVQAKLGLKTVEELKNFGEENFVKECKKYVAEITEGMTKVREKFGLWMERDSYQTSNPGYLSMAWRFFKAADEKGLLYKDYKTVAWCPRDETTLSDYEIKDTYTTLVDPSIYVKFPINEKSRKTTYSESFLIWTTTPWTLQSNMAIAVNPEYDYSYALVEINGKEEVLIIADALVEKVIEVLSKSSDIKFIEILKTVKGAELEGVKYDHIYFDETPSQQEFLKEEHKHIHSIILADYVTLGETEDIFEKLEKRGYKHSNKQDTKEEENKEEDKKAAKKSEGTGLVHIAPGHGFDDYEAGKKYNLPIFCPVGPDGKFTEGKYEGEYFKDVDPIAISYLKEKGFLLHAEEKSHRYPCCWRCKTPIVYRAADQWWIKRSEITQNIVKENMNVHWTPSSARDVFNNLMQGAGDWAISRQRYWGIPIPVWEDEDGNYEVFESKEELEERIGKELADIHRDDIKDIVIENKTSGKPMKPVPFITDVWFESGCASFASHYGEGLSFDEIMKKYYPIKWISEGEDQIRGWFSSLFSVGYILTGKAPYNEVLFQRFVMDKNGVKMSKSLGNGIEGNEAIERWGSDATRYYLLTKRAPEEQINFDPEEFSNVDGFFNTLENLTKFINSYLEEYKFKDTSINMHNLEVEDLWLLYKLNITLRQYINLFEKQKIHQALKTVEEFVVKDLSKTHLKIVKERTDERDEDLLKIFSHTLKTVLIMLSPAMPFKTEELYQTLNVPIKKESIYLENMPDVDELIIKDAEKKEIDVNFDISQDIIQAILNAREKAKIGVRWPLGQVDIIATENTKSKLEVFEKLIKKLTNIAKINYDLDGVEIDYIVKPNFAKLKQDFDNMQDAIKSININKAYIAQDLKKGEVGGTYDGVELDFEKHILKEIELRGELASSDFNGGYVVLHTHQDEILLEEGFLREIIRRVQATRKELGFEKKDIVKLSFDGSEEYLLEITLNWSGVISKKVGASEILENKLAESKEFEIKDKKLVVSIQKE